MDAGYQISSCRICEGQWFEPVLDLGFTPYADAFLTREQLEQQEEHFPLKVVRCAICNLVQLTYVAPRESLYPGDYPYLSSTTKTGVAHYHKMAKDLVERFHLAHGSLSIDIGSNVGVLGEGFREQGLYALGIEPVPPIARMAALRGIETINEFFSAELAAQIVESRGPASVVTGTNVVAHIDNLRDLIVGVKSLLVMRGVFVFEAPYLGDLVDGCAYDTIYHEHLSYLSVGPIQYLCSKHGMQVFDVERETIHGGTLRYFISAKGDYPVSDAVTQMIETEFGIGRARLNAFSDAVRDHQMSLCHLLYAMRRTGDRIVAIGAPAKGMTLLNVCGLGPHVLDYATEKAPTKIGRFTPGVHLPVVPDETLFNDKRPDYGLILSWNFAEEIIANLSEFTKRGGQFIIPMPAPTIIFPEKEQRVGA